MKPRVLKTEADYQEALAALDTLMDAQPGSPEMEDLELLSVLIELYEQEHYAVKLPDPISAIQFRMEQQGLTRKDLVAYIGSQSRVSEVLNGKRPLSLAMIRALHTGLGISAEVLLQQPGQEIQERRYDPREYPIPEMFRHGYFPPHICTIRQALEMGEELLEDLFAVFRNQQPKPIYAKCSEGPAKEVALRAWQARAMALADSQPVAEVDDVSVNLDFIHDLVKLSDLDQGPLLVRESLQKRGIAFVILPHLPHTYLDGACFHSRTGRPMIGMTLRHDRLDNFWFTLVHELIHAARHLNDQTGGFFDDTETSQAEPCHPIEDEANQLARDVLIPPDVWEREQEALLNGSATEVVRVARRLHISPAIVAGRIRWQSGEYSRLNELIGRRQVRKLFQQTGIQS